MIAPGLSVLLGFGFSFFPGLSPFLAVLVFLTEKRSLQRSDAFWLLGSCLLVLPLLLAGDYLPAIRDALQLLGALLLFRAFALLRKVAEPRLNPQLLGVGLLLGFASVIATVAVTGIEEVRTAANLTQALVWSSSPALFGHTSLVLGLLIAAMVPAGLLRSLALLLAAVGILLSGSREAALAWSLAVVALQLFAPIRSVRGRVTEVALLILVLLATMGAGARFGFGGMGFLVNLSPGTIQTNLLSGTELKQGDWWFSRGTTVETSTVELGGTGLTAYTVAKTEPESWRRLQQVVRLTPGQAYTASVWIAAPEDGVIPGLQGWGQSSDGTVFVLTAALRDGTWNAAAVGAGTLLSSGLVDSEEEWARVWATFVYEGDEPVYWWLGLTPDQREGLGGRTTFAGFQLEAGQSLSPYQPAPATQGLSFAAARMPYWQAALSSLAGKPLTGAGAVPFSDYYLEQGSSIGRFNATPSHTHSLPLQVLFERGIIGLAGLAVILFVLVGSVASRNDVPLLIAIAAAGVANIFDYSFFHAGVMYPLASIAGWRAAADPVPDSGALESGRQALIRLTLALVDSAGALLSFVGAAALLVATGASESLTQQLLQLPDTAAYLLFLWPLLSMREGLYPGYGLTAPQELRKAVQAAVFAGLLVALVLLLTDAPRSYVSLLLLAVLLSLVLLPALRALTKRVLFKAGYWGRPVVVIGDEAVGAPLASALKRNPLDGLQPVALLSTGSSLVQLPAGVHRGSLAEARKWVRERGVRHALVALPRDPAPTLDEDLRQQLKLFRDVQYIPHLPGLPVLGVQAGSVDNVLALEVRNELADPWNRAVKRTVDLLAVIASAVLVAPVMLLLALAIRIDSPGPAFFTQRRLGRDGKPFRIWKFRTMVANAEEVLHEYLASHPELRAEWDATQKLQDDPRVTRVGRFLRATSLDELPQLLNVLRGEMSLVGPRPIVDDEVAKYEGTFELYKMVRPGLTGYWQVSGRSDTDYVRRVELDSFYVRNWSVWLDIVILVKTVGVVLRREGAY